MNEIPVWLLCTRGMTLLTRPSLLELSSEDSHGPVASVGRLFHEDDIVCWNITGRVHPFVSCLFVYNVVLLSSYPKLVVAILDCYISWQDDNMERVTSCFDDRSIGCFSPGSKSLLCRRPLTRTTFISSSQGLNYVILWFLEIFCRLSKCEYMLGKSCCYSSATMKYDAKLLAALEEISFFLN